MKPLVETLAERVLVCDGAMGTQVYARGFAGDLPPDICNLEHPEIVAQVHAAYIDAGSRVVITNTFGATRYRLEAHGLADRVAEVNETAARIAREAAADIAYVLGDIGPSGHEDRLAPYGDEDPAALAEGFEEQARALAAAGVDGIIAETFSSLGEAEIAVAAAATTALPVFCTMSFRRPPEARPDDFRSFWGDTPEGIVERLSAAGAVGVGANCGEVVEEMPQLAARLRTLTDLAIVCEPNAGRPALEGETTVFPGTPDESAKIARELVAAGANIVGGCCGTTPEHIRAIAEAVGG